MKKLAFLTAGFIAASILFCVGAAHAQGTPQNGEVYHLVCQASGMALDNGGSTSNGGIVTQWTDISGNTNQAWKLVDAGGGYFNLLCQTSGMALDNSGSTSNGGTVWQWSPVAGQTNQKWMFVSLNNGYYNLICATSGMALDNRGSTTTGTAVQQWTPAAGVTNQAWRLELVPQSGSIYNLICATSGMALDNSGSTSNGGTVYQWTSQSGNANQEWQLVGTGNGYYNLICQTGGMALDNGGSTSNGGTVYQWTPVAGQTNQKWQLVGVGNGYYNLICQTSGMALDNWGSLSNGQPVKQYTQQTGNTNQEWRFIFVSSGGGLLPGPLPSPWFGQDIGSVGIPGSNDYTVDTNSFTLTASGADITGTADAFRFISEPITGDIQLVARVASVGNANAWSKAGLMIRATTAPNSANASVVVTPGNGVSFQWRTSTGGSTSALPQPPNPSLKAPYWIELSRSGNTFTALQSPDGVTWTQIGTATVPMVANVFGGLAGTSHNNSVLNTGVIDNVMLNFLPSPWLAQDIGSVGLPGSTFYYPDGAFMINGSGADISGGADALQYAYRPVTGNCSIIAEVESQQNTDPWAKAGLMFRNSLSPSDQEAAVVVTPGHGVSFQWRASSGGSTSNSSGAGIAAPYFVKLARSGSTFTASQSPDGATWTTVGTATVAMGSNVYVGLPCTSHNNSKLNTSIISNVSFGDDARGLDFAKKTYVPVALPTYDPSKLPTPIIDSRPELVSMYWKCWQLAYNDLRQPASGSPFVSNYIDAAFNSNIFQWDTVFMMMFMRYGNTQFPAIQSLDNLYSRQHPNGFICREIQTNGTDVYNNGPVNAVNPPIFSWGEVETYKLTGDNSRFAAVLPPLEKYSNWLNLNGSANGYNNLPNWVNYGRHAVNSVHQLYWNTGFGCGMDNSPRQGTGWVDMSCQVVLQYNNLATICDALNLPAKASAFRKQAADIGARINKWCWNEQDGFYYDVQDDGTQYKVKTAGGFWPMLAGITTQAQSDKLVAHLQNPNEFWRPFVFPTLAANEPQYTPTGGYWLGGVWAPTNYMIVKGLQNCGYEDFATQATDKYLTAMATVFQNTGTVWENYAPENPLQQGNPARPNFVGWTGIGPISMLIENILGFRGDAAHNTLTWRLTRTDHHGIQQLHVGNATLSAVCAARSSVTAPAVLTLTTDKAFTLIVSKNGTNTSYNIAAGTTNITAP